MVMVITITAIMATAGIQDVEPVQAGKHGDGGFNCHVFHGVKGHDEVVSLKPVTLKQVLRFQIHVV